MLEFNEVEKKMALDGLALVSGDYRTQAEALFKRLGALPENPQSEVDFFSNEAHTNQDMAEATERVAKKVRDGSFLTGRDMESVRQGLQLMEGRANPQIQQALGTKQFAAATQMGIDLLTRQELLKKVEQEVSRWHALRDTPFSFTGNESMGKLLGLLAQAEMPRQYGNVSELMLFISGMEQQLDNAYAQLRSFKQEIASVRETVSQKSFTEVSSLATRVEWTLDSVRNRLNDLKADLAYAAQNIVDKVKGVGLTALSKLADAFSVKESLEGLKKDLHTSANLIAEGTARLEGVTKELRAAADHAKNAGRALAGKEQQSTNTAQPYFSGLHKIHDGLAAMEKRVDTGISRIEDLKHAAEKPSLKRSLQKAPDEKKALTVPTKQHEKSAPER